MEAQTMDSVEVYENNIAEAISQYCIDHKIKPADLYTIDQSRWNSVLMYIYKYTFKPLNTDSKRENSRVDYNNIDLLNNICDIYISLCYEYSKEVSVLGFSKMTGINPDTIYSWGNEEYRASCGNSDIYQKLNREREESLSARLFSNKGNPVGILGILNSNYARKMGQPRGAEQKQKTPDLPGMERKYLEDSQEKPSEIPLPKQEF